MSEKELIKLIRKLPAEARQEAVEFVKFLTKKYIRKPEEGQVPSSVQKHKSNP